MVAYDRMDYEEADKAFLLLNELHENFIKKGESFKKSSPYMRFVSQLGFLIDKYGKNRITENFCFYDKYFYYKFSSCCERTFRIIKAGAETVLDNDVSFLVDLLSYFIGFLSSIANSNEDLVRPLLILDEISEKISSYDTYLYYTSDRKNIDDYFLKIEELKNETLKIDARVDAWSKKINQEVEFAKSLRGQYEGLSMFSKKVQDEIELEKTIFFKKIDELDHNYSKFSGKISALTGTIETEIDGYKTRMDNSMKSEIEIFRHQIEDVVSRKKLEIDEWLEHHQAAIALMTTEYVGKIEELDQKIEFINIKKQQVENIAGAISEVALKGNFAKLAEQEYNLADKWRSYTVYFFYIAGIIAFVNIMIVWFSSAEDIKFSVLFAKFLLNAAFAIPAIYAARQSARHRDNAERAKQIELEFCTLEPYIANMNKVQQDAVREKLVEKYFGRGFDLKNPKCEQTESVLPAPSDFFEKITGLLEKIVEKKGSE